MDRHEYKRQNARREARIKAKILEEAEAKKIWYERRPKWWKSPTEKFSFIAAAATCVLACFAAWQLIVMRGQLNAMERDQQPYVSIGDKLPKPQFTVRFKDKGTIDWAWNVTNFGKGEARDTTVDAFMRIGNGASYKRSPDRTAPGWMGELPAGRTDNGQVSTDPIYSEDDFKKLSGTDYAFSLLLEIEYVGLNDKRFRKEICITRFALGGMGIDDPENCKKSKEN
jgi:hypothetical protein